MSVENCVVLHTAVVPELHHAPVRRDNRSRPDCSALAKYDFATVLHFEHYTIFDYRAVSQADAPRVSDHDHSPIQS